MLANIKLSASFTRDIVPVYLKDVPSGVSDIVSDEKPIEYGDNPQNKTPYSLEANIKFTFDRGDPVAKRVTELLHELNEIDRRQRDVSGS